MTSGVHTSSAPSRAESDPVAAASDLRREQWADLLRLVASAGSLPWVLWRRSSEVLLWGPLLAVVVSSLFGLYAARHDLFPRWRRAALVLVDVALLVYLVWALGSVTTPVALFLVMAVLGSTLSARPRVGLLATAVIVVTYGTVLFLESRGVIPIAPLARANLRVHETTGGRPFAFATVSLACTAAFAFVDHARRKLEQSALRERELRVAEQAAQQKASELQRQLELSQRMESMGRLAGGVAHDFNNVLGVIQASLSYAIEAEHPNPEVRTALEEAQDAARRAGLVVRQMLAFSRRQPAHVRPIHPAQVIRRVRSIVERIAGERVTVSLRVASDLATVRADPTHLEQILLNLATNSRDAMPSGGTLVITARNARLDPQGDPAWPGAPAGDYVELAVSDSGHGMDAETVRRAVEPFFTTKPVGQGTGLGLSTTFGILAQHGGHLRIDSQPGAGTTVTMLWPSCSEKPEPLPSEGARKSAGIETVLLVEDESALRTMLAAALRRNGYTVLEAASGEDAIDVARGWSRPIHVLVADLVLPGKSGREVAVELRALREGIRVLFISGYSPEAADLQTLLVDGEAFLQKPFEPERLMGQIRGLLAD